MIIIGSENNKLLLALLSIFQSADFISTMITSSEESWSKPLLSKNIKKLDRKLLFFMISEHNSSKRAIIETLVLLRKIHREAKSLSSIIIFSSNKFKNSLFPSNFSSIEGHYWCNAPINLSNLLRTVNDTRRESNLGYSIKYPIEWVKMLLIDFLARIRHSMQNQHLLFMEVALEQFKKTGNKDEMELAKKLCENKVLPILNEIDFIIPSVYYKDFESRSLLKWREILNSFFKTEDVTSINIENILNTIIEISKLLDRLKSLSEA